MKQRPRQAMNRATMHRATQKEKTLRAFRAYLDLLDTAEWMLVQLRGQLEAFDLTIGGFRLLEMLYREGPMRMSAAAEKRQRSRQNLKAIINRLEERGWVRREVSNLPPAGIKESHLSKAERGRARKGKRISMLRLTPLGEKFIGVVFPKHAKVVKSLMRAIDSREQESLSRICRKLREGDVVRFTSEMTHLEVEE